jgi:DNA-nicking Smr family endonuclease
MKTTPKPSLKTRSLQDLGTLKKTLQQNAQEAAEREAQARVAAQQAERERHLFSHSVGRVQALPQTRRAELSKPAPAPEPRQRALDEKAVLASSLSDGFDVDSLLETDDTLSYRRADIGPDVLSKLRRGGWAIQAELDLHGLRRDEARDQLAAFVRSAAQRGLRCLRVVHGKGNGSPGREPVLKTKVRSWLVQKQEVIAFVQARASEGGNGALIVLLRPSPLPTAGQSH